MLHDIWFQHNTVALIGSCNSTLSSMTHFSVREGLGGGGGGMNKGRSTKGRST